MSAMLATNRAGSYLGHVVHGLGPETVLVFHDRMGDAANYSIVMPFLDPDRYSYVLADLRGYGGSRDLGGLFAVEEGAADAFYLAGQLGRRRFHVVGHSMSGVHVQRMAVDDWISGFWRQKSVVAITLVSAGGNPADEATRGFRLLGRVERRRG